MKRLALSVSAAALVVANAAYAEPKAEVLHWWTSGGEAKSVAVLQKEFADNGGTWTDMPVAGGGGDAAMTALRARVLSGNAPTAVQLKGPAIQEWYPCRLDLGQRRRAGSQRHRDADHLGRLQRRR